MKINFNFKEKSSKEKILPIKTEEGLKNNYTFPKTSAFNELNELIGLNNIKALLNELEAYVYIKKIREKEGLLTDSIVLHMIFKGSPGTGKTTIARIIAKFFKEIGVLSKGHLIEVERADLVGEYIGHTAQRTKEKILKAIGGILFIDEAYSLARGGERDFGREAIDCLVKGMEDYKDKFILILAGYKEEMERFIRTNPGLTSRFPIQLDFPDYTLDELVEIAKLMLAKKEYKLTLDAEIKLRKYLRKIITSGYNHNGNARLVRNIIEKAIRKQACRLITNKEFLTKEILLEITEEDLCIDETINFYDKHQIAGGNWSG